MANEYDDEENEDEDEDGHADIYLTVDTAKYPFLKNMKIGQEGTAKFKGEILEQGKGDDSSKEDEDEDEDNDETHSLITISDLIAVKKNVRV